MTQPTPEPYEERVRYIFGRWRGKMLNHMIGGTVAADRADQEAFTEILDMLREAETNRVRSILGLIDWEHEIAPPEFHGEYKRLKEKIRRKYLANRPAQLSKDEK